jgi:hypothetical protein
MSDCTCDKDTLINDPGMTTPGCPVHDQKPKAVTQYVKAHGSIVSLPPADPIGDLRRFHKRLTASGVAIATNKADDPIDVDKLREHTEGDHG